MTKCVLVLDDEPNIRIALELLMRQAGHAVCAAADGEAGLAAARTARPDLIVLDVMMPKLDGFAVLSAVRADPLLAGTRVLMLTAKGREADQRKARALGADAYMTKPFATSALITQVEALLAPPSQEDSPTCSY